MKKILKTSICIIALLLFVTGCAEKTPNISLIEDESYFDEFYVENDRVVLMCKIALKSTYKNVKTVNIYAYSPKDVEGGLLVSDKLLGYNSALNNSDFIISAGESRQFEIYFVGEFGGRMVKENRLLPEKIEFVVVD